MEYKLGFIGAGHMGGALIQAAAKKLKGNQIIISDKDGSKAEELARVLGCDAGSSDRLTAESQYIIIGVKPQNIAELFEELAQTLKSYRRRKVFVTMAAGVKISRIWELAGERVPVIRIMPNTPVAVGEGCILYTYDGGVTSEEIAGFLNSMEYAGKFIEMSEELIDAGCAISGCGPAFVYQFIMALAEAGEKCGLPREIAMLLAEQTAMGSAKLAIDSGEDPSILCDHVCSPGGSTIEGVKVLRRGEFNKIVSAAVAASFRRTVELGNS